MIMDSKGKLFGKVSIVDLIIVVLLIVAIVGAYVRFSGRNTQVVSNNTEFYYTLSVESIRETNKNLLENSVGTPFRLSGKINSSMGELVDVETTTAVKPVTKTDGTIVLSEVPERYDVKLTFKVIGNVNDKGYFTPENHEISAAKKYDITNINCTVSGKVDKVWVK